MAYPNVLTLTTPEQRMTAYLAAFGWQGGTIHQVVIETGCNAYDLLHGEDKERDKDHTGGWFAARTCSPEFNRATNFPRHQGDLQFWLGFASGWTLKQQGI